MAFEVPLSDRLFAKSDLHSVKSMVPSNFQPLKRDFAFILDVNTPADKIVDTVLKSDPTIESVQIFDVFEGGGVASGKKSIALQVTIWPSEKTLTEEDLRILSEQIASNVAQKLNGELRSF
jgi:phenylalanyl-tRNA synthetase beta chain